VKTPSISKDKAEEGNGQIPSSKHQRMTKIRKMGCLDIVELGFGIW
jgi:hypothetical protein